VLLALNACLKARADEHEAAGLSALADAAIEHGRTLPGVLAEKTAILSGLARLRELTARTLNAAGPVLERCPSLAASWERDGRFFAMFGVEGEENGP